MNRYDKWDSPPMASTKMPQSPTRAQHHNPGDPSEHNRPEGGGVLGNLSKGEAMQDSPVPGGGMPNKGTTSKAGEVSGAMSEYGNEFSGDGVMRR